MCMCDRQVSVTPTKSRRMKHRDSKCGLLFFFCFNFYSEWQWMRITRQMQWCFVNTMAKSHQRKATLPEWVIRNLITQMAFFDFFSVWICSLPSLKALTLRFVEFEKETEWDRNLVLSESFLIKFSPIFSGKERSVQVQIEGPWVRFPAGLRCVFSSNPAVSSSFFVGEKEENLIKMALLR